MAVKTEVQTVRMTPRIKFSAGLAARHERMSLSTFIEAAIEEKTRRIERHEFGVRMLLADVLDEVWFPVESARFCFLADRLPSLMNDEEKVLWQLIQADDDLWHTGPGGELMSRTGTPRMVSSSTCWKRSMRNCRQRHKQSVTRRNNGN